MCGRVIVGRGHPDWMMLKVMVGEKIEYFGCL
jgi:hypothetical protein